MRGRRRGGRACSTRCKDDLIRPDLRKPRESGELCIDLLMVAKYFERIGDHAVNVAEWVQYSLTGKKESA